MGLIGEDGADARPETRLDLFAIDQLPSPRLHRETQTLPPIGGRDADHLGPLGLQGERPVAVRQVDKLNWPHDSPRQLVMEHSEVQSVIDVVTRGRLFPEDELVGNVAPLTDLLTYLLNLQ